MPDPKPEQPPLTDPVVPPLRDPPDAPYRDPVQPPPNDPPPRPLRDPDPPGYKDPPAKPRRTRARSPAMPSGAGSGDPRPCRVIGSAGSNSFRQPNGFDFRGLNGERPAAWNAKTSRVTTVI